MIKIELYRS